MKENRGMSTKTVKVKEYSAKDVGLLVQVVILVAIMAFGIASIFNKQFMIGFYIMMSLELFTMAFNNINFYKRKNMTVVYIIIGIFVLLSMLVEYVF